MRTNAYGQVEQTFTSLPFGDEFSPGGQQTEAPRFGMLDRDSESDTEHAQYRQYSSRFGRWMSPDPYSGSYDFSNPQSFNRYAYVNNRPLSGADPSGLFPWCGFGNAEAYVLPGAREIFAAGCVVDAISTIFHFMKPSFHGSLTPRPEVRGGGSDDPWNESLGYPKGGPALGGNWGISGALGIDIQRGCDFGVCGGVSSFGADPRTKIKSLYDGILEHLEKIRENPEAREVTHWEGEIRDFRKQIIDRATKVRGKMRSGAVDKYLEDIIGVTIDDLNNLLPSPTIIVNQCIINPAMCGRLKIDPNG